MIAWFPTTRMLYLFYECFLQLPKLLQVSYCNVVFLREYYVTEVIGNEQNHHAPVIYKNWG